MSDVLIKGMEMPKSCYSEVYSENGFCPFHCFDYHGGSHCTMSACKCLKTRRPKDCPLIPVPEHGRLIEAHFDYEEFKKRYKDAFGDDVYLYNAFSIFNDMIVNAPTVLERTT